MAALQVLMDCHLGRSGVDGPPRDLTLSRRLGAVPGRSGGDAHLSRACGDADGLRNSRRRHRDQRASTGVRGR
jgi:hypothetical protein